MDNTRISVLCIVGNYNIDLVMGTLTHWPTQGTEMMLGHSAPRPDDSAGNCALTAATIRFPHCTVDCQGNGTFAPWLAAQFPGGGARWPQYPRETSLTMAITHPSKERSSLSNHGHITRLTAGDVLSQLPAVTDEDDIVLLYGTSLCTGLLSDYPQLLVTLHQRGFTLAVDTGWPPRGWSDSLRHEVDRWLGDCGWLLFDDAKTLQLAGHPAPVETAVALATRLSDHGGYVVKHGANDTDCWTIDSHHHTPTRPVTVIDTIDADDSLNAGFLVALLSDKSTAAALRWGNTVAVQTIGISPRHYLD